jgi:hypothetical protein
MNQLFYHILLLPLHSERRQWACVRWVSPWGPSQQYDRYRVDMKDPIFAQNFQDPPLPQGLYQARTENAQPDRTLRVRAEAKG